MKFRSFIWISGIALLILLLVQYYFITETFKTKQEQFDSKYSSLAKFGLFEFENRYMDYAEDSVLNLLDDIAYFAIHDAALNNENRADSIEKLIFNDFQSQLNKLSTKKSFLKDYFHSSGEDSDFVSRYVLKELSLLSFISDIQIYPDSLEKGKNSFPGYLINSYTVERNYYRIQYDFYISFTHRSEQIAREMYLSVTLSVITLMIVFTVFFLTLRNLLIQKRLSDLKTDFINNMTHELKTPLSTISVASSSLALKEGILTRQRIEEISGIIKKQNKHLSSLIDKILDISIWEKDQVRIEKKPVAILPFLQVIFEDFKRTNPQVKVSYHKSTENPEKKYSLDEVHMATVINNLLSNALKYGGNPPSIELSVESYEKLKIVISDNGQGIPIEEQKHIFDKFFRGSEAKKKAIRGLGLGLYYVKQIVSAHGGRISLDKNTERGSRFEIEIPE